MKTAELFPVLAMVQGAYYLATGVWSLVSPGTFQKVTGPKTDVWLVKTVGVLVSVIGAVLGLAGLRGQTTREVPLLAVGSAAGLAAIEINYAGKGRISPIYLADAALNALFVAAWMFVRRRGRSVPLVAEVFRRQDETEEAVQQRAAAQPAAERLTQPSGEALGI